MPEFGMTHGLQPKWRKPEQENLISDNCSSVRNDANPTRCTVESDLAKIEGCKYALTFSSGCAAINAIHQTILSTKSHVISKETIYGGTTCLLKNFEKFRVAVDFMQGFSEVSERVTALLRPTTKIIWIESPANPTLQLVDIEEIVRVAKIKNPDAIVVVDNTFLTPIFQKPLELGADICVYSCSKYFSGHQDLFMGSIAINSEELYRNIKKTREATGAFPSKFECELLTQSLRTLQIRMNQHSESAFKVAQFLVVHSKVEKVVHPGLPSHPQHLLALKQQFGHSGALGLYLRGNLKESNIFLRELKVFLRAPSLGASFSIANLPSKRSHADVPSNILKRQGITDNYIRLSVGLESSESLIADLDQALSSI